MTASPLAGGLVTGPDLPSIRFVRPYRKFRPVRASLLPLLLCGPLLAGCESSMRIGTFDNPFGSSARVAGRPATPATGGMIEPAPTTRVETAPLSPVTQQDLAPPPGASSSQAGIPPVEPPPVSSEPPKIATAEPPKVTPPPAADAAPARPTQTSVTGNWSAREANGTTCKVTLSSSPKLDLYGASTSGCQSKDLQRVIAWELRGEDVYLYQPGGAVAARLKARGRQMDGALAQTGAPVVLSK